MDGINGNRPLESYSDRTLQKILDANPISEALETGLSNGVATAIPIGAVGALTGALRGGMRSGEPVLGALVGAGLLGGLGFIGHGTFSGIREYRKLKRLKAEARRILEERQLN